MSTSSPPPTVRFEPEFVQAITELFEQKIVFNQHIGLKIDEVLPERVSGHLDMRPELIGHYAHHRLHGGVISAALDAMGGLAVLAGMAARHMDDSVEQRMHRFAKLGTIDLRIDYLRPAVGSARFTLHAEALRLGSRVASTRMAFHGEDGTLLAVGAAAYIVS
ncbi:MULTISPECIES: thioesterase family protein [Hydrogenophaga]|uniref:Thioesterase superfamily protein n=1 Tax=Hydrogenophaga intermedia TaxID=65786 RepID=A0A1L1PFH6_HYDIT|nr:MULTISPECIES: thioesterase family protein [Hydrogenophaga]AOS80531.1 thioesterase [Hydrogenophaga sp. PBC]TMU78183.1 thioesterase family protein [Hydrogenophaga intermedia]CDN88822.1 Thioesterase superfamily protein [Hydrogenophaga intermedia]